MSLSAGLGALGLVLLLHHRMAPSCPDRVSLALLQTLRPACRRPPGGGGPGPGKERLPLPFGFCKACTALGLPAADLAHVAKLLSCNAAKLLHAVVALEAAALGRSGPRNAAGHRLRPTCSEGKAELFSIACVACVVHFLRLMLHRSCSVRAPGCMRSCGSCLGSRYGRLFKTPLRRCSQPCSASRCLCHCGVCPREKPFQKLKSVSQDAPQVGCATFDLLCVMGARAACAASSDEGSLRCPPLLKCFEFVP